MNARNTPAVGATPADSGIESLPEAHCFLTCRESRIDVARFADEENEAEPIEKFLYEEIFQPAQIGSYKLVMHRRFFRGWIRENNLDKKFSFEELWKVREKCIASLAQ